MPAELVGRVFAVWLAVTLLQIGATVTVGWVASGPAAPPAWGFATLISALTLGGVMLLIGRIAFRMFDEEIAGLACLACAVAVPLMAALSPVAFDRHGLQAGIALQRASILDHVGHIGRTRRQFDQPVQDGGDLGHLVRVGRGRHQPRRWR